MRNDIAIYPGTFDPITRGHMDVILSALKVCDTLIIAVAEDSVKSPIFTVEERLELVNADIKEAGLDNVEAKAFKGLLVDYALQQQASLLVRGLRAVSDFEYEFQLAAMNSKLAPNVQTIFIPATDKHQFVASKMVKEICQLGGDISSFVSPNVERRLKGFYSDH